MVHVSHLLPALITKLLSSLKIRCAIYVSHEYNNESLKFKGEVTVEWSLWKTCQEGNRLGLGLERKRETLCISGALL